MEHGIKPKQFAQPINFPSSFYRVNFVPPDDHFNCSEQVLLHFRNEFFLPVEKALPKADQRIPCFFPWSIKAGSCQEQEVLGPLTFSQNSCPLGVVSTRQDLAFALHKNLSQFECFIMYV